MTANRPEIKICGLTQIDEAVGCAEAGADAIGLVFYPPSPRHLTVAQAREISRALPEHTARVGVFVNASLSEILEMTDTCRLTAVQLHGQESPDLVSDLNHRGIPVVKGLFMHKAPFISEASRYPAAAFLVECGTGRLPGGNALTWNWADVKPFGETHPLILAGGLSPETIEEAVAAACPDAVDVSSGVESSPGRKDLHKVHALIQRLSVCIPERQLRSVWNRNRYSRSGELHAGNR
jgi:phosphoribosylanthranilate isomerase